MKRFVVGLLLFSLQYGASAMQTENTAQQNPEANQEELERITVTGDDQISVLRYMVQHADPL